MAKTRPGIDRISKKALQAGIAQAEWAIKVHFSQCVKCHEAAGILNMRCSAWWLMAIDLHRMRRQMKLYKEPELGDSDPLPGT